ncbi:hypothetical protein [Halosimplex pelagicum]|uniref:Uncharacterized protein n=1 Tax=Halosimplex pelagicum TaxID=869886 RepID=A0A7D5TUM8_9EURY|nr:hypothetical protein [Halosimplex pelagicum]QLH83392.1 hypothetical protein HZS54_17915 [Halosimplex pelagicum]
MLEGAVPLAIDLSADGYSTAQLALAVLVVLAFLGGLTVLTWRLQYHNLEGDQPAHKRALRESKTRRDPEVLRFGADAIEEERSRVRRELRELVDAATGADVATREYTTVRAALGTVRSTVRETWRDATTDVPGVALQALERALLVVVFGAVAVSTSTIVQWLTKDPDYPTAADVVAELQEYGGTGGSTLLEVLGLFPFSDLVWALLFTVAFRLGQWIFAHWYVVAGVLVGAGLGVWYLEREVLEEPRRTLLVSRSSTTKTLAGILVPTWIAGAVSTWVGELVGFRGVGELVGLLLAMGTLVVGVVLAFRRARTEALWTTLHRDEPRGPLLLDWSLRHTLALLGPVALALAALYVVVGLADGSVARVVAAFLAADRGVQGLVGLVALGSVALVVYMARDAAPAVREALVESLSRGAVRTVLLVRGVPVLLVVLVYLLAFGFNLSFPAAVALAIVAGVVGRVGIVAALRVRATASLFGDWLKPDTSAVFLVVRAYELEDADGTSRYYAEVNSKAVAHDSREELVDAVLEVADGLVDEEETDPTVPQRYAEDLLSYGIVGVEASRKKTIQRIREETEGTIESDGAVSRSQLERDLEGEYPPELAEKKLREWIHSPGHRLRERDGYLYLGGGRSDY